jgi:group I intron endonuclease
MNMVEFKYKFPFSKPITNLGMGIYGINCEVNSKIYIGSSVDITTRWRCHLSCLRRKTHHSIVLQRAFNLYGEKLFSFVVLENLDACGQSYDGVKLELLTTEQKWIDKTKSAFLGYNIQPTAGNPSGQEIPEDVKIKMCLSTATKLDEDKVIQIKEMLSCGIKSTEIAEKFGVSACHVNGVKMGRTWKHIKSKGEFLYGTSGSLNPSAKLSERDVIDIRNLFGTMTVQSIADKYNVSKPTIEAIKYNKTWRNLK